MSASRPVFFAFLFAMFLARSEAQQSLGSTAALPPEQLASFIDEQLENAWKTQRLAPSNPCLDSEYLRRVYLDIVGVIPSEPTVKQFLSNPQDEKRHIVVDELLASEAYARYAAAEWGNLLVGRGTPVEVLAQQRFRDWLAGQFKSNVGFDKTTRSILTASGTPLESPATTWILHHEAKPENLTAAAARIFLGTQIQCAQCHDHPFSSWRQEDFYGLAAFFVRTSEKRLLLSQGVSEATAGEIRLGGTADGEVVKPRFLGRAAPTTATQKTRREQLADWLVDPSNKLFARAIANRVWGHLLGRGLVDPVDDMSDSNPSVYPEVLDALADQFIASGYDMKYLVRAITRTRAYQVSSRPSRNNKDDQEFFSKGRLRRLGPEQLVASVVMSTGLGDSAKTWSNPLFQILMQSVQKDFIFVFASMDETTEVSEFRGTIAQALLMMNSKQMAGATDFNLLSPLTAKLLKCPTVDEKIQLLFLSTLSREPSSAERRRFGQYFRGATRVTDQLEICEDIYWALLNSNEFTFNH